MKQPRPSTKRGLLLFASLWVPSGHTTSKQHQFNVESMPWRWINVESMLLQRCVPAGYRLPLIFLNYFIHFCKSYSYHSVLLFFFFLLFFFIFFFFIIIIIVFVLNTNGQYWVPTCLTTVYLKAYISPSKIFKTRNGMKGVFTDTDLLRGHGRYKVFSFHIQRTT